MSAVGTPLERRDARAKATGTARYADEQPVTDPVYVHPVLSTVARGSVTAVRSGLAEVVDGVLTVLDHTTAPRLASTDDQELAVLQSDRVGFRGQIVAAVIAETAESARRASGLVSVSYAEEPAEVQLIADDPALYVPDVVNPSHPTDSKDGDVDVALASAPVTVDETYTTPMEHNNPMEPHATTASWDGSTLTLHDSTQGAHPVRSIVAETFGLDEQRVRVIAPHVGGGFGSKGTAHAHVVLAALAAMTVAGRPVKLALPRQQMFSLTGYRTPTIQRVRLGADDEGRLTAIAHDVVEQTSRIKEFAEQTATVTRNVYAAPNRRTTHRLAALDVPVPSWMRAPGVCPGMFALETAMDELAARCGVDPIELRLRNEPDVDPETGKPFSSRNLVACLRTGARRFGWQQRDPAPRARLVDGWLVGTGVASSTYPVHRMPGSTARIRVEPGPTYRVEIGAADIGTGTWTTLAQIVADALDVPVEQVDLQIGDTALPKATVAGGSSGVNSWGSAVVEAARTLHDRFGRDPRIGAEAYGTTPEVTEAERYAMHAFGAQFAEVRVHADTGEVRVPRMLSVFAAGRIVNPRTARSQFLGGMTMGLSMALHEESHLDPRFGHVVNRDLAEYHVATNADVESMEVDWVHEDDPHVNAMGTKGIGEIGIVGAAAAVGNATWHATGVRVRDLPITPDKLLP